MHKIYIDQTWTFKSNFFSKSDLYQWFMQRCPDIWSWLNETKTKWGLVYEANEDWLCCAIREVDSTHQLYNVYIVYDRPEDAVFHKMKWN